MHKNKEIKIVYVSNSYPELKESLKFGYESKEISMYVLQLYFKLVSPSIAYNIVCVKRCSIATLTQVGRNFLIFANFIATLLRVGESVLIARTKCVY